MSMSDPARTMSFDELNQVSIRTGCETELNRWADTELKRRGYVFQPTEQVWQLEPAAMTKDTSEPVTEDAKKLVLRQLRVLPS